VQNTENLLSKDVTAAGVAIAARWLTSLIGHLMRHVLADADLSRYKASNAFPAQWPR
jgi:hypothetical protein